MKDKQYSSRKLVLGSILVFMVVGFLPGCSSFKKSPDDKSGGKSMSIHPAEIETFRASEPEPPELAVPEFDNIPEDVQPQVQKWLNYFQGKGREHMERYLSRSTRYERLMKRILRENDIPEDIIYIALIESGFSPRAISRSRAVGYWQFIRGTGKRYGLAINTFVDERRDPVLATQAAADYFKGLYAEFNSWFLSMASYNVGEGRVRREINRNKTRDFWVLAKKHRLPKETLNYVPKYLAARLIAKKPEAYGFTDIPYEPPIEFETVAFNQAVNMKILADKINVDYAELKRLNPKFRGEIAPLDGQQLELRVPLNMKDASLAVAADIAVKELVFVPDRGETDVYKLRAGDTLLKIAKRFKTNVGFLREINDFKSKTRLKPGRTIFVPIPSVAMTRPMVASTKAPTASLPTAPKATSTVAVAEAPSAKVVKPSDEALYVVQEGESLAEIAVKNNMTMEELMELNSFTEGQTIAVGMQLRVKKIMPEAGEPSVEDLPSSVDTSPTVAKAEKTVKPGSEASESATPVGSSVAEKTTESTEPSQVATADSTEGSKVGSEPQSGKGKSTKKEESKSSAKSKKKSQRTAAAPGSRLKEETQKELYHKVKPGETLYRIALIYKTTVEAIQKANQLDSQKVIRAGSMIKIPNNKDRKTSRSTGQMQRNSHPGAPA